MMKNISLTRWLPCILVLVCMLMFTACGKADDHGHSNDKETSQDAQNTSTAEGPGTEPVDVGENITLEQLKNYVLIRPDESSDMIINACVDFRKALIDVLGTELLLKSDIHSETVATLKIAEFEILLGNCDRDETRKFAEGMKRNDYGYAMVGKKLVIYGGSDESTAKALRAFIRDVVKNRKADAELFYDGRVRVMERGTYAIDTFTLQGNNISEYTVVYPNRSKTERALAQTLVDRIAAESGIVLNIISDKEKSTGKEILIGTTKRTDCTFTSQTLAEGTYLIGAEDNYICARGAEGIGNYYAVYALITSLLENAKGAHQVTLAASKTDFVPMNDALKAMSFNLWVSSPTAQRQESVYQTIMEYMPDTIGVQEASPTWMAYLSNGIGDIYAHVGLGRDGGSNGEHSAIFYRKDRFELIESNTKWMSATPDVVSKYKESSLNRIFTYAILLEKKSNTKIMVVNTHLEHTSEAARNLQITVLMDFLKDYTQYPIILTGDFNSTPQSVAYQAVVQQLVDSSTIAQTADLHYTFHNYGKASAYIDFIFVSPKNIMVSKYRVITEEMNGMLPSDHYALIIDYNLLG